MDSHRVKFSEYGCGWDCAQFLAAVKPFGVAGNSPLGVGVKNEISFRSKFFMKRKELGFPYKYIQIYKNNYFIQPIFLPSFFLLSHSSSEPGNLHAHTIQNNINPPIPINTAGLCNVNNRIV